MEGVENFMEQSITKVYDLMLLALRGGGWVLFFQKKERYVTLEWHGTRLPFITTLCIHACVSHLFQKEFLDEFTRLKLEFVLLPVSILKVHIVAVNKICGNLELVSAQSLSCS